MNPPAASASSDTAASFQSGGQVFATTHWTVILTAGRGTTPEANHALETLCRTYWYLLYAYVRRRGHSPPLPS